ncbi:prefoldin subunit 3-like [Oscarella lobularis]|uniref:prefoldin subunit 3-like n=1 Tax=Oscarella lobularis TaxID=121494 RepID=UPI0033134FF9
MAEVESPSCSKEDDTVATKNVFDTPKAEFVEDVNEFMKSPGNESVDDVLRRMNDILGKYKVVESSLLHRKSRLLNQIPELNKCLDCIKMIESKKDGGEELSTHCMLSDQVYIKANVPPTDRVCLWLGANVMLEYELEEAKTLLHKNLDAAERALKNAEGELGIVKDQRTTMEVNIARIYNWGVKKRQTKGKMGGGEKR